jgi:PD-(D/E)XK nuclease superfamily
MFNLQLREFEQLEVIENGNGRFYVSPTGKWLPSVTTVANFGDKSYLDKWRKRVGDKEAEKIRKLASDRGNIIHNLCETYLNNKEPDLKPLMPNIKACFLSIKPFLNRLDNIQCLETCLYSDKIGLAGRVDCIAEFEGKFLAIIDFKGSNNEKELDKILPYCLQVTAYSLLYKELTGIDIKHAIVVMAVEKTNVCKKFPILIDDYKDRLMRKIDEYQKHIDTSLS